LSQQNGAVNPGFSAMEQHLRQLVAGVIRAHQLAEPQPQSMPVSSAFAASI